MSETITIDGMIDALAHSANTTIKLGWERRHPVEAAAFHEAWRVKRSKMLGAEITSLSHAQSMGWDLPPTKGFHSFSLAMRLPDGRIGLACNSRENKTLAPPRELGDPIREHLMRVATTFDVGERPEDLPPLPACCRRALIADGLSPDGVETIAASTRLLEVRVGSRKHKAMLGLAYYREQEWKKAAFEGRPQMTQWDEYSWGDIRMILGQKPKIEITGHKLIAHIQLPATIVSALPGRDAACFTDHPALAGMIVTKATQNKNNLVLTLKEYGLL